MSGGGADEKLRNKISTRPQTSIFVYNLLHNIESIY